MCTAPGNGISPLFKSRAAFDACPGPRAGRRAGEYPDREAVCPPRLPGQGPHAAGDAMRPVPAPRREPVFVFMKWDAVERQPESGAGREFPRAAGRSVRSRKAIPVSRQPLPAFRLAPLSPSIPRMPWML